MPKKAATARSGAQRNKAKAQKSFEVVRQNAENQELVPEPTLHPVEDQQVEAAPIISAATPSVETSSTPSRSARRAATRVSVATQEVETKNEGALSEIIPEIAAEPAPVARGNSASARLAARRGQKLQQRTAATLVTAEHYSYVRRDLMIIAVLASVMFIAIIVLYFAIGRG